MPDSGHELRRHVTATALVAAFFFIALGFVLVLGRPAAEPSPQPTGEPQPLAQSQDTVLVQVSLGRTRLASLLTGVGNDPSGAVVLSIPPDTLVPEGPQYTPLLDANLSLNRDQSVVSVSSTLGVRVDNGWRMERKALAGFVDAVRGVTVTVSERTAFYDDTEQLVMILPAGTQVLEGPQASWYVMGTILGEDTVAGQQARFQEVLLAAVAALPEQSESVAAILTSLGGLSDPLNGVSALSEYLVALRAQVLADAVTSLELPLRPSTAEDPVTTREADEGGPEPEVGAFRAVEYGAAVPLIREAFRYSPRIAGVNGDARVLVWNGTGNPAVTLAANEALVDAGLIPLSAGAWTSVDEATWVNGRGFDPEGVSWARVTARALAVPTGSTLGDVGTRSPVPTPSPSVAPQMPGAEDRPLGDVDTVIGLDFRPCPITEPDCLTKETP